MQKLILCLILLINTSTVLAASSLDDVVASGAGHSKTITFQVRNCYGPNKIREIQMEDSTPLVVLKAKLGALDPTNGKRKEDIVVKGIIYRDDKNFSTLKELGFADGTCLIYWGPKPVVAEKAVSIAPARQPSKSWKKFELDSALAKKVRAAYLAVVGSKYGSWLLEDSPVEHLMGYDGVTLIDEKLAARR